MRLSPKNRSYLIYPLVHTYHHLFIKLRALRQVSLPIKVFYRKKIRTAFCSGKYQLGRVDLCKFSLLQKYSYSPAYSLLQFKNSPLLCIAQSNRPCIQQMFQRNLQFFAVKGCCTFPFRLGKYLYFQQLEFHSIFCSQPFFRPYFCLYATFLFQLP